MNVLILQYSLNPQELARIHREFPQLKLRYYHLLDFSKFQMGPTVEEKAVDTQDHNWKSVEILFGNHLTIEELKAAKDLRWIHNPSPSFSRMCLKEVIEKGNIIVTVGTGEYHFSVAEFVLAGILSFAKNLLYWKEMMHAPSHLWENKMRDNIWNLPNRILLQIGLNKEGTEIARLAKLNGMKVWGMEERRSFHPFCEKSFVMSDLLDVLPKVDVVSICLSKKDEYQDLITKSELEFMKQDSVLIVIGPHAVVNEHALVEVAQTGKLRGIILDVPYGSRIAPESPLWTLKNLLVTPEIAARPRQLSAKIFQSFHYNLRQYKVGNFNGMRGRVEDY